MCKMRQMWTHSQRPAGRAHGRPAAAPSWAS